MLDKADVHMLTENMNRRFLINGATPDEEFLGEFEKGWRYLERLELVDVGIVGGGWASMVMATNRSPSALR